MNLQRLPRLLILVTPVFLFLLLVYLMASTADTDNSVWPFARNSRQRLVFVDFGANRGDSYRVFMREPNTKYNYTYATPRGRRHHEFEAHLFEANPFFNMDLVRTKSEFMRRRNPTFGSVHVYPSTIVFTQDKLVPFHLDNVNEEHDWWASSVLDTHGQVDKNGIELVAIDAARFLLLNFVPEDFVVLKMDIEGAEYDVVPHLCETGAHHLIDALYIELHSYLIPVERRSEAEERVKECIQQMEKDGVLVPNYDSLAYILMKIILLGDSAVGKSKMIERFLLNDFVPHQLSTYALTLYRHKCPHPTIPSKSITVEFWDTAGQERFQSMHPSYYISAHCCILCFDMTRKVTYKNLDNWYDELIGHRGLGVPVVVVANKVDMDPSRARKSFGFVERRRAERVEALRNLKGHSRTGNDGHVIDEESVMPLYFCSASDGTNVVAAFKEAVRRAVEFKESGQVGGSFVDEVLSFLREEETRPNGGMFSGDRDRRREGRRDDDDDDDGGSRDGLEDRDRDRSRDDSRGGSEEELKERSRPGGRSQGGRARASRDSDDDD
ncbi:Rab-like protein 2A [Blyttiomyces sp. JEL0837]|nr:Rab-like protein 2A [Blyttiomyces sp. JEL0837]